MNFRSTILTSRQWEVIAYRAQGLTQAQVAKKLKTTRENVNEIEHRARMKINGAKATLAALQGAGRDQRGADTLAVHPYSKRSP